VVQRAPHRVAHNQPIRKGAVVVSAVRAHRKEFVANARHQDIVVTYASRNHAARLEHADGYSVGKIPFRRCVRVNHVALARRPRRDFDSTIKSLERQKNIAIESAF
jgi:hypothetical protein